MKNNLGKLVVTCALFGGCFAAPAQDQYNGSQPQPQLQYDYPAQKPAATGAQKPQQLYQPPRGSSQQLYQPGPSQQQYQPRPQNQIQQQRNAGGEVKSFDPLAGNHKNQQRPGGFWEGVRADINPCERDYGIVLDGWHDMELLATIKSVEMWVAFFFIAAFVAVAFDDLFRKGRMDDMREATAGAALIFVNDRNDAVKKANEAIYRHNILVAKLDKLSQQSGTQAHIEMDTATRTVVRRAAEDDGNVEQKPAARPVSTVEAGFEPAGEQSSQAADGYVTPSAVDAVDANDQDDGTDQKLMTLSLGGEKHRVPAAVLLNANAQNRKVENLRNQVRKLEERLKPYEKE